MNLFNRYLPDENSLKSYGFVQSGNDWSYAVKFENDACELTVFIREDGTVTDSLTDFETGEPYTPYKTEVHGFFVDGLREYAQAVLEDILSKCFLPAACASEQANQVLANMKE